MALRDTAFILKKKKKKKRSHGKKRKGLSQTFSLFSTMFFFFYVFLADKRHYLSQQIVFRLQMLAMRISLNVSSDKYLTKKF